MPSLATGTAPIGSGPTTLAARARESPGSKQGPSRRMRSPARMGLGPPGLPRDGQHRAGSQTDELVGVRAPTRELPQAARRRLADDDEIRVQLGGSTSDFGDHHALADVAGDLVDETGIAHRSERLAGDPLPGTLDPLHALRRRGLEVGERTGRG